MGYGVRFESEKVLKICFSDLADQKDMVDDYLFRTSPYSLQQNPYKIGKFRVFQKIGGIVS